MSDAEFQAIARTRQQAHEAITRGYAHAKAMIDNGDDVMITVGPALLPISLKQRKFLHGPVLGQIAEQVRINGERFVTDIWKAYFKRMFLTRWEMQKLPGAKRATPRKVIGSTERLGIRAYAQFTDQVIDYAVLEWHVQFVFEAGEREATRPPPGAKAAKAKSAALAA